MTWAAGLGAAGISTIGGFFTNSQSAKYSAQAAAQQYQYNLALQKQAQEWQERMSNTAHQREVDDLYAAGLNPILSATGGSGASAGSAGLNSTSAVQPNIQNPFGSASELLSIANNVAQVDNLKAQTENLRQNTSKQAQETIKIYDEMGKLKAEKEEILSRIPVNSAQAKKLQKDIELIDVEMSNILEDTRLKAEQISSVRQGNEIDAPSADFAKKHPVLKNLGNFRKDIVNDISTILHGASGYYDKGSRDYEETTTQYDSRGRVRSSSKRRGYR